MKKLFFQKNITQNKELEECMQNLQIVQKSLYDRLKNNEFFLDYLEFTNREDIVECFSQPNILVNYDNIIKYINENVNTSEDFKMFLKEIEEQAHEILQ